MNGYKIFGVIILSLLVIGIFSIVDEFQERNDRREYCKSLGYEETKFYANTWTVDYQCCNKVIHESGIGNTEKGNCTGIITEE